MSLHQRVRRLEAMTPADQAERTAQVLAVLERWGTLDTELAQLPADERERIEREATTAVLEEYRHGNS